MEVVSCNAMLFIYSMNSVKVGVTSNLVLFLLSDKADYINGENINVNGGILLK